MNSTVSRLLLALSALILLTGGPLHAAAFGKASALLGTTSLPPFYTGSFRALWLIDSATLISLAATFGWIAARPSAASRPVIVLLALIPGATAGLIYHFVGGFFAAHLLMIAALAALVAGLLPSTAGAAARRTSVK